MPVVLIGSQESTESMAVAEVILGGEVTPADPAQNPAGVMVRFHIWNEEPTVELTDQAQADAWGAAHT